MHLLIRIAPWLVLSGLVIWGLNHLHNYIYTSGQNDERIVWQEREADRIKKEGELITAARKEAKDEAERQHNGLIEVINEQAKLNDQLERNIASLNNKRMLVNVKPAKCDSGGVPAKAENTREFSAELGRENLSELSEAFGREVSNDYIGAEELVIDCKTLLDLSLKFADVE